MAMTEAAVEPAVVVGVDGSGTALHAVRWAVQEAHRRGAALRIVHVAPYALGSATGTRRADAILALAQTVAGQTDPGVVTVTERLTEPLPQGLVDATGSAQLLVVGMAGGSGFDDVVVHSTALDVCATVTCPVAVVRGRPGPLLDDRPVVLGIESVASDAAAVTVAFRDAQRRGTGLQVLHAVHEVARGRSGHDVRARAEREVGAALAPWCSDHPGLPVELRLVSGSAAAHLLEASVSTRLLVVGTRARGPAARTVLGSTSRAVARRSSCPVIVVRHDARLVESSRSAPPAAPARPSGPAPWALHPHDRGELW